MCLPCFQCLSVWFTLTLLVFWCYVCCIYIVCIRFSYHVCDHAAMNTLFPVTVLSPLPPPPPLFLLSLTLFLTMAIQWRGSLFHKILHQNAIQRMRYRGTVIYKCVYVYMHTCMYMYLLGWASSVVSTCTCSLLDTSDLLNGLNRLFQDSTHSCSTFELS